MSVIVRFPCYSLCVTCSRYFLLPVVSGSSHPVTVLTYSYKRKGWMIWLRHVKFQKFLSLAVSLQNVFV